MSRKRKVWFFVAVLSILLIACATSLFILSDHIVARVLDSQLRQHLPQSDSVQINFQSVNVRLVEHQISFDTVSITYVKDDGAQVLIPSLTLRQVGWQKAFRQHVLSVGTAHVANASLSVTNPQSGLTISADSIFLSAHDLYYSLADSVFLYNDSLYYLSAKNLIFDMPDSHYQIHVARLITENSGQLSLSDIVGAHTVSPQQLATVSGNQPVVWNKISLSSLTTSPVNLPHLLTDSVVEIDQITATGAAHIYRDKQFKPTQPYLMPQQALMAIDKPFVVRQLRLNLSQLCAQISPDGSRVGTIQLHNIQTDIANFTNHYRSTIKATITANLMADQTDQFQLSLSLFNNSAADFKARLSINNLQTSALDSLLVPMVGVKVNCPLSSLKANITGNRTRLDGDLCAIYPNLELNILSNANMTSKEQKRASMVNFFAPMFLHKANPLKSGEQPRTVNFHTQREPNMNMTDYLFAGISDGIMQTIMTDALYKRKHILKQALTNSNKQQ